MFTNKKFIVLVIISNITLLNAATHLVLDNGIIKPQIYSIYYLKRPSDLIGFLNQNHCKLLVDTYINESSNMKKEVILKMDNLNHFTTTFMDIFQAKCSLNHFLTLTYLYTTIVTERLKRRMKLLIKDDMPTNDVLLNVNYNGHALPDCDKYFKLNYSMYTFDHLAAIRDRHNMKMDPETELSTCGFGIADSSFPKKLAIGLAKNPRSWKLYTLSSLYWRYAGDTKKAIECARLGVYWSPRATKDLPLLSLGTIFQRSNYYHDSVIVLNAAVDHNDNQAENHFALATSLFLLSEFKEAFLYYSEALYLDSSYFARVDFIRKSFVCFKYAKERLTSIENNLHEMLTELDKFPKSKKIIKQCIDKLPWEPNAVNSGSTTVIVAAASIEQQQPQEAFMDLLNYHRTYCTTIGEVKNDSLLYCDFFNEMQFVMDAENATTDLIKKFIAVTNDLIKNFLETSLGVFKHLDLDRINELDTIDDDIK